MVKIIVGAALVALSLATGGVVAIARWQTQEPGFTCPITGEELPCPKCCPLN
jgi:hypothetical protein